MSPMYTFTKITQPARKTGRCPECGARRTRSTTLYQTLSPFNRAADGSPKSVAEVRAELRQEAAAWSPDFTCTNGCPLAGIGGEEP